MVASSLKLIGAAIIIIILTAAATSLAQNTSNPALGGNTVNPVTSLILPQAPPVPVSPAPNSFSVNFDVT
jgi:hypothetical protein